MTRSGLALRRNIDVVGVVIDPAYRGEVKVLLVNNIQKKIFQSNTIAQMIFEYTATSAIYLLSYLNITVKRRLWEH